MSSIHELTIISRFISIIQQLDIAYVIGGSLASSIYGKVRFTQDADITVEPFDDQADKLFEMIKPYFYISQKAMYHALRHRSSFNIIHLESAFKIDIFVRSDTAFEKLLMARRNILKLSDSLQEMFAVVSPEDIILLKLQWYRDGGCSSQRQLDDILGILTVQGDGLDFEYLNKWACSLEINELLKKAISENTRDD